MIYSVKGELVHSELIDAHYLAVVECDGVGYAVRTTQTTMSMMPKTGSEVKFYTYLYIREDAVELFGFGSLEELNCFKMLISVSGVGPRAALSILSDLNPGKFALCVATGDAKSLTRSKGIGGKIAQRIVLELKDKITKEQSLAGPVELPEAAAFEAGSVAEAISALVVLGYAQSEAAQAVARLDQSLPVEELIKRGLKALASGR